jgi:hypothetical protein
VTNDGQKVKEGKIEQLMGGRKEGGGRTVKEGR